MANAKVGNLSHIAVQKKVSMRCVNCGKRQQVSKQNYSVPRPCRVIHAAKSFAVEDYASGRLLTLRAHVNRMEGHISAAGTGCIRMIKRQQHLLRGLERMMHDDVWSSRGMPPAKCLPL